MAVPSQCIVPRTFILKPGMVLFLGGLGRVDYIKGQNSCWLSVVASNQLPVHISRLERAEELYAKHAGKTTLLGVPTGGAERMQQFPALEPHDVEVDGLGPREAAADIQLFSAGWVAVTAAATEKMLFRVHTPAGTTPGLRRPPLLPYIVTLKGERIRKTPAYKALKPEAPAEVKRPRR
ncbi:nitric oxide-associated protein 1-like [Polypterus senegalus]